jgi:hypothetical protein
MVLRSEGQLYSYGVPIRYTRKFYARAVPQGETDFPGKENEWLGLQFM